MDGVPRVNGGFDSRSHHDDDDDDDDDDDGHRTTHYNTFLTSSFEKMR